METTTQATDHEGAASKPLLKSGEAARFLGVNSSQLQYWRDAGQGPPYYRMGKYFLYDVDDLRAFKQASRVIPNEAS